MAEEPLSLTSMYNLTRRYIGTRLACFEELDSTNDEIQRWIQKGNVEPGLALFAEHQSQGKGRFDRRWWSMPRRGLLVSVVLKPDIQPSDLHLLVCLGSLAMRDACGFFATRQPDIRWPNDLVYGEKKISGILAKGVQAPNKDFLFVLGFGVNLNLLPEEFPEDLRHSTTSLQMICGTKINRTEFAKVLLNRLEIWYLNLLEGARDDIERAWRGASYLIGRFAQITSEGKTYEGQVVNVSLSRGIGLLLPDGSHKYFREENVTLLRTGKMP